MFQVSVESCRRLWQLWNHVHIVQSCFVAYFLAIHCKHLERHNRAKRTEKVIAQTVTVKQWDDLIKLLKTEKCLILQHLKWKGNCIGMCAHRDQNLSSRKQRTCTFPNISAICSSGSLWCKNLVYWWCQGLRLKQAMCCGYVWNKLYLAIYVFLTHFVSYVNIFFSFEATLLFITFYFLYLFSLFWFSGSKLSVKSTQVHSYRFSFILLSVLVNDYCLARINK